MFSVSRQNKLTLQIRPLLVWFEAVFSLSEWGSGLFFLIEMLDAKQIGREINEKLIFFGLFVKEHRNDKWERQVNQTDYSGRKHPIVLFPPFIAEIADYSLTLHI